MRNRYCRHCNEKLVFVVTEGKWFACGKMNSTRSYGSPTACPKSPTDGHEPRP